MKTMFDFSAAIDWFSMKMTGATVIFAVITGNPFLLILTFFSVVSTIVYNAIRIVKELKKSK